MKTNPLPLTLTLFAATVVTTMADDWPQYRGPNHDGTSNEKLLQKRWPTGGPATVWRTKDLPDGFSSFTVAGGRAFTLCTRKKIETVVAVDALSGKELWSHAMTPADYGNGGGNAGTRDNSGGDGPRSTPTVDGDRVYALSADLVLDCLDARSGKPVWRRDLIKENAARNIRWENAASPLIDGNLLFVAGGGDGQALLALDKSNGKVVWATQNDLMTHATPVLATIHNVRQVVFFTQTGLVGCEVRSGKVLWRHPFQFSTSTAAAPIVAGDIVYCSAGYGVGSTAVRLGRDFKVTELWRIHGHADVANHWSTPVHRDGYLYGMFSFKKYGDGPLKCVELKTGKVIWEKEGFGAGNVIIADGHVIALTDSGELVLVEATPAAYREAARARVLTGKCWTTPTLSNGRLYVRSTKEAACLDLTGKSAAR